jgi:hypothetical protein
MTSYISLNDVITRWGNFIQGSKGEYFEWRVNQTQSEYFIKYKKLIGENEALLINEFSSRLNKRGTNYKLFIEFIKVKLITPVFVSNIFLLTRMNVEIVILLPFEDATSYQLIQILGIDFYKDNTAFTKLRIYRQKKGGGNYSYQPPVSVISESYLPSIHITDNSFKEYFYSIYNFTKCKYSLEYQKKKYNNNELSKSELYNFYCELILNDIGFSSTYIINRGQTVSIDKLEIYFNEKLNSIQFLERLQNKSLIYVMLLRILIINSFNWKSSEKNTDDVYILGLVRSTLKKEKVEFKIRPNKHKLDPAKEKQKRSIDEFIEFLNKLFNFADSIYPGLYEIAKNVIEHSSNKSGALSIRVFNKKDLYAIKNIKTHNWIEYLNDPELDKVQRFVDISIVDDGEVGIFDTLYKHIESRPLSDFAKETDRQSIENDLRQLTRIVKTQETNLGEELYLRLYQLNIFNENNKPFTFQLKKASAGYGLMIFTANIFENKGCYFVNTYSPHQNANYGFFKSSRKNYYPFNAKNDLRGTQYNFVLPILLRKLEKGSLKIQNEPSGFVDEDIFKYLTNIRIVLNKEPKTVSSHGINYYKDRVSIGNKIELPVYNFADSSVNIDRSELLRFLADINLTNGKRSHIIVYNLNYQTLVSLMDLLRIIYTYFHKIFWSDPSENSQSILFYCKNNETNLFSAFLLCGKSISALMLVNKKISYYQYVDIPIKSKLYEIQKSEKNLDPQEIQNILKTPFFVNEHPIFFDMLLKATKYHTLFEANVHELLTKEIV